MHNSYGKWYCNAAILLGTVLTVSISFWSPVRTQEGRPEVSPLTDHPDSQCISSKEIMIGQPVEVECRVKLPEPCNIKALDDLFEHVLQDWAQQHPDRAMGEHGQLYEGNGQNTDQCKNEGGMMVYYFSHEPMRRSEPSLPEEAAKRQPGI